MNKMKRTIKYGTASILILAAFVALTSAGCMKLAGIDKFADLSKIKNAGIPSAANTSKIFSADGVKLADIYMESRVYVPIKDIPKRLQQAFVAVEDERFYEHGGVDTRGAFRALFRSIAAMRKKQGASTITMQLARNLYLTKEKTMARKTTEILIAIQLEKKYTKDEILEAYLNQIYFGHGAYGVKAASDLYFNKDLKNLTIAECAVLAEVVKGPGIYSPFVNPARALARRDIVIDKMLELKFISQEEHDTAKSDKMRLAKQKGRSYENYKAPFFVTYVINMLTDENGEFRMSAQQLAEGGYKITTTLDSRLQSYAERSVKNGVAAANLYLAAKRSPADSAVLNYAMSKDVGILAIDSDDEYNRYIDDSLDEYCKTCGSGAKEGDGLCSTLLSGIQSLTKLQKHGGCYKRGAVKRIKLESIIHARNTAVSVAKVNQGALSAIDVKTGGILAMVGGVDFSVSRFNHVWPAERQAGSSFKPFVYLTALTQGHSMDEGVLNSKYCVAKYCPKNYGGGYGDGATTTFHNALAFSLNIPAVRVGQLAGEDKVIELCRKLGLTAKMEANAALPLGVAEISPLQMSEAYAAIANGGIKIDPGAVVEIRNSADEVIYKRPEPKQERIAPLEAVKQLIPAMEDVVRRGTGTRARIGRPVAGKTGTTSNFRDAWFVGFSPDVAAAVWIGNDDNSPLCSNRSCRGVHIPGGYIPAPVWRDFMKHASAVKGFSRFEFQPELTPREEQMLTAGASGAMMIEGSEPGAEPVPNAKNDTGGANAPSDPNADFIIIAPEKKSAGESVGGKGSDVEITPSAPDNQDGAGSPESGTDNSGSEKGGKTKGHDSKSGGADLN